MYPIRVMYSELDTLFKKYPLEKDVCVELVKYLKSQPQFKIGTYPHVMQ
jgi:hypothetical protein